MRLYLIFSKIVMENEVSEKYSEIIGVILWSGMKKIYQILGEKLAEY